MRWAWKSALPAIAGGALALAASAVLVLSPNLLRALISRHWLYTVDASPLDPGLAFLAVGLALACLALAAAVLFPRLPVSRRRRWLGVALLFLFLVPAKNGAIPKSIYFSLAGLAAVLVWQGSQGARETTARSWMRARAALDQIPPARWQALVFAVGVCAYALIATLLYQRIPHSIDETDYLFQARIFARGQLWAPAPPSADFFHLVNLINHDGKWLSQYPPGWPALLAVGVAVGAPWLVNPLLGGLLLVLTYRLARELFTEDVARTASLLALASPYLLLMNSSMMSHPACGLAVTGFMYWFARGMWGPSPTRLFPAALCLGLAALTRPYTALLVALPAAGVVALALARRTRSLASVPLLLAGLAAPLALLFLYNRQTTGSALVFGYQLLYGPTIALGFGPRQFPFPHTLAEGLRVGWSRLQALSQNLVPSAVPAVLLALPARWSCPPGQKTIWLALTFLALPAGHVLYFFQDFFYEPRFLFESSPALIILCALGLETAGKRWNDAAGLRHFAVVLVALGLLLFLPAHLAAHRQAGDLGPQLQRMVEEQKIENGIVLVEPLYYPLGMMLQSPFLDGKNIYARDLTGRQQEILALFPQRSGYRFFYDAAGKTFRLEPIAAGP